MTEQRAGTFAMISAQAVFDKELGHAAIRVLAALGAHADKNGKCWPSELILASETGISERHVRRALRDLKRHGYIEIKARIGECNSYRIPRTWVSGVPRTPVSAPPDMGVRTPGHGCPPNNTNNRTKNSYGFGGKVIRLTQGDYDTWAKAYPHIDLWAELQALDDWYDDRLTGAERSKWYARCSQALAKKNREARQATNGKAGYDPDVIH